MSEISKNAEKKNDKTMTKKTLWNIVAMVVIIALCLLTLFRSIAYMAGNWGIVAVVSLLCASVASILIYIVAYYGWGRQKVIPVLDDPEIKKDITSAWFNIFFLCIFLLVCYVSLIFLLVRSDLLVLDALATLFIVVATIRVAYLGRLDAEANRYEKYTEEQYTKARYRKKGIDDGNESVELILCEKTGKYYTAFIQAEMLQFDADITDVWKHDEYNGNFLNQNTLINTKNNEGPDTFTAISNNIRQYNKRIAGTNDDGMIMALQGEKRRLIDKDNEKIRKINIEGSGAVTDAEKIIGLYIAVYEGKLAEYAKGLAIYWEYLLKTYDGETREIVNRQFPAKEDLLVICGIKAKSTEDFSINTYKKTDEYVE